MADTNPVLETSRAAVAHSTHVRLDDAGIANFAEALAQDPALRLPKPADWASELLHPVPSKHGFVHTASWIFMVSGLLNFSFWSECEDQSQRFAVRWHDGVDGKGKGKARLEESMVDHTGYWSLPAAINRALEEGIQVTSHDFWLKASDDEWKRIFRPSPTSREGIPLLEERIRLLRETGQILTNDWQGSFHHFLESCGPEYDALSIVKKVVGTFPAFKDESVHPKTGQRVHLWKRAQILVAELWAAFSCCKEDPSFPQITRIERLTMFADYRVPQILHHLNLITYSDELLVKLSRKTLLENGSELEISIRCASIVAVEELRLRLLERLQTRNQQGRSDSTNGDDVHAHDINAVLIDFWLWNRAKQLERQGKAMVECHRTRSIWY